MSGPRDVCMLDLLPEVIVFPKLSLRCHCHLSLPSSSHSEVSWDWGFSEWGPVSSLGNFSLFQQLCSYADDGEKTLCTSCAMYEA